MCVHQGKRKGWVATHDIAPNTLILLEPIITGTMNYCIDIIKEQLDWKNSLHPLNGTIRQKIKLNSFDFNSDDTEMRYGQRLYALGKNLSFFNHSCTPNAVERVTSTYKLDGTELSSFGMVFSTRHIKKGEEICIFYFPHVHHQGEAYHPMLLHRFKCNCPASYEKRVKIDHVIKSMSKCLMDKNRGSIYEKMFKMEIPSLYTAKRMGKYSKD